MGVPTGIYHTALKGGKLEEAPALDRWESPEGDLALTWDIQRGLPDIGDCDVIYAEVPWPAGFKLFEERAGHSGGDFHKFIDRVATVTSVKAKAGVPVYLVAAESLAKRLGTETVTPIYFNGGPSVVHTKGPLLVEPIPGEPYEALLDRLAKAHRRVWDFCCGYGRTGKHFAVHGKRWTMTDINATCIGVIARDAPSWK